VSRADKTMPRRIFELTVKCPALTFRYRGWLSGGRSVIIEAASSA
jgi:hypothetical protein